MQAYSKAYLDEVVENQGKLFDLYAQDYPNNDTEDFIQAYMKSKTRKYIDESQAYVNTMDARELLDYFFTTEKYEKILAAQAERRTQHNTSGSLRWAERFGTLLGKNPAAYSGSDRSGAWPVKA